MTDELLDELRLGRALRLDARERVRLDVRGLAETAAAAEQALLVRWILAGLALALVLPALAFASVATAIVGDPALVTEPLALVGLLAVPFGGGLADLAQPATAIAVVAGIVTFTVVERREYVHVHETRT